MGKTFPPRPAVLLTLHTSDYQIYLAGLFAPEAELPAIRSFPVGFICANALTMHWGSYSSAAGCCSGEKVTTRHVLDRGDRGTKEI
jgi:hypothetical protein